MHWIFFFYVLGVKQSSFMQKKNKIKNNPARLVFFWPSQKPTKQQRVLITFLFIALGLSLYINTGTQNRDTLAVSAVSCMYLC